MTATSTQQQGLEYGSVLIPRAVRPNSAPSIDVGGGDLA